jgi:uncharacterized membrane protein YeaQ/YmgE (transglycosylase-associated protein family)
MGEWLWTLILSGAAGFVGSLLFKGKGSGLILNLILGLLGGSFATWLFGKLGFDGPGRFFDNSHRSISIMLDCKSFFKKVMNA